MQYVVVSGVSCLLEEGLWGVSGMSKETQSFDCKRQHRSFKADDFSVHATRT